MSDIDWTVVLTQFITTLPLTIPAVVALIVALRQNKKVDDLTTGAKANADKVDAIQADTRKVEISTNSMKDALVAATRKLALMEGHSVGVREEKGRAMAKAAAVQEGKDAAIPLPELIKNAAAAALAALAARDAAAEKAREDAASIITMPAHWPSDKQK